MLNMGNVSEKGPSKNRSQESPKTYLHSWIFVQFIKMQLRD